MARKTIEQKLAELEKQKQTLKARLGKKERATDTRRKVLIGALILNRLRNTSNQEFTKRLHQWLGNELPEFLTREGDKELFAEILGTIPETNAEETKSNL